MTTITTHGRRIIPRGNLAENPDDLFDFRIWLAQHHLPDPDMIPLGSEFFCDDDAKTVTVERWALNKNGNKYFGDERNALAREWVTVQLEEPAAEPPDCCTVYKLFPHEHEPLVEITALNDSHERYLCKHCHDQYWGDPR